MIGHFNLKWRLTLFYCVVLSGIILGFGICTYGMMARHLLLRTDLELEEEIQELQTEVNLARTEEQLLQQLRDRFYRHVGFEFQVRRLDGTLLFLSEQLQLRVAAADLPPLQTASQTTEFETRVIAGIGEFRLARRRAASPSQAVLTQAFQSTATNRSELRALLWSMLLLWPLSLLAALGGGRLLAWSATAPIHRMTETAALITASRLQTRIPVESWNDELAHLARTLNLMMDRVEAAMKELQRFTADAAHELRTPLAVLLTEAEVALRTPRTAEEYQRVIEVILGELQRLNLLADQLLELSRLDSRKQLLPFDEVPLDALLADVVEHVRVLADRKGVQLDVRPLDEWVVLGDDIKLSRLLFNLVENAVKFTPAGGRVTVAGEERNGQIDVIVSDTGIGIAREDLPHLGERFFRADKSRNGGTGGTGLGLAISRAIVEAHAGTMEITSELHVGTTVRVSLPLLAASESQLRTGPLAL